MIANTFVQNIYYHYILSQPSLAMKFEPEFFSAANVQVAFKIAKDYVIKYHQAPTAQQMKELTKINNVSETLTDDIIDYLYAQQREVNNYGEDWLYDNATNWAILENVKKSIIEVSAYLKLNQADMESGNAKEIVEHIKAMFNKSCVIEFSDEIESGSDFWDAESHKQKKLVRSSSGYPFIDFCLNGGYFPGCLICFVGAPKVGKSLLMQNLCAESVKKGENCIYITLELPEEMVTSRIGANMFSVPSLEYEKYSADTVAFKEKIDAFRKRCLTKPGELIVKQYPTSTLSVLELESFLLSKEEELSTEHCPFKFKNVFIDYLNIMKNYRNPNSENTYMKIKQIAEDIRAMGTKNGWAIITATQTNRSQFDTNDIQTNQVSESSALGATVDAMFGIISDAIMFSKGEYYLKCMYDRVSPQANKKKKYICNFNFLRLEEDVSEGILDATLIPITDASHLHKKNTNGSNQTFVSGSVNKPTETPQQVNQNLIDGAKSNIETVSNPMLMEMVGIKTPSMF